MNGVDNDLVQRIKGIEIVTDKFDAMKGRQFVERNVNGMGSCFDLSFRIFGILILGNKVGQSWNKVHSTIFVADVVKWNNTMCGMLCHSLAALGN